MKTKVTSEGGIGEMMRNFTIALVMASFPFATAARAQAPSGPKAGAQVKPFKATAGTGEQVDKSVDLVAARMAKPTVYVFIQARDWDRPLARFVKTLDEALAKGVDGATDAEAVAVWLTEDREKSRKYLPLAQQSLKFTKTTLAVFDGDTNGPLDWDLDGAMHATAVVVRDGKAVESFGFVSANAGDLPKVVEALQKKP